MIFASRGNGQPGATFCLPEVLQGSKNMQTGQYAYT